MALPTLLLSSLLACSTTGRFVSAEVTSDGLLRIVGSKGDTLLVPPQPDQVGFDEIVISPDHSALGWLALYEGCCTSYPLPLRLMLLTPGGTRVAEGELPVWGWHFLDGGRRVAYRQATVHGGRGVRYELREVSSGRLLASFDPPLDSEGRPLTIRLPRWARGLDPP